MGVVVRRYIDFLILLIPTPLVSALFLQQLSLYTLNLYIYNFIYVTSKGNAVSIL